MEKIPREIFVREWERRYAYADTPLEIGEGQTISAPHMVGIMCEALRLEKGNRVLEVGTGSGYHAAVVAKIVGDEGRIYSIERLGSLAEKARKNLDEGGIKNVIVIEGDGSLGLLEYSPYDRIYVTCAAPKIPKQLIDQLKKRGKLLIPVGDIFCRLILLEKNEKNGKIKEKDLGGCAFVPLIGKEGYKV
jgi:protein-L-isoaspartate(D-aspartate) O-methyltransferase